MEMIHCPNCNCLRGFKRALGFGTLFMVVITCGLWLLVIPLYPARCTTCGQTRSSAFFENLRTDPRKAITVSSVAAVLLICLFLASRTRSPQSAETASEGLLPQSRASGEANSSAPQAEPPFQAAQVTASVEQLMIDRQTGGAAAAERYVDKIIEVSGIVDAVDSAGEHPSISFKATGSCPIAGGNSVNCFWMAERERNAVARLHSGDSVTVLGRFSETGRYEMPKEYDLPGCAYYITLRNCTVMEQARTLSPPQTAAPDNSNPPAQQPMPNTQLSATATPETKPAIADRSIGNTGGSSTPLALPQLGAVGTEKRVPCRAGNFCQHRLCTNCNRPRQRRAYSLRGDIAASQAAHAGPPV